LLPLGLLLVLSCGKPAGTGGATRHTDSACPAYAAEGLEVSCVTQRQNTHVVLRVDLKVARVKVLWKSPDGVPYGSLDEAYRRTACSPSPTPESTRRVTRPKGSTSKKARR
jgi:hypothetical protein